VINLREKAWWQGTKSYGFWSLLTPANRKAVEALESGNRQVAFREAEAERLRLWNLEREKGITQDQINRAANGGLSQMILCLDGKGDATDIWPFHVFNPAGGGINAVKIKEAGKTNGSV
jgi:hypothetical protein